MISIRKFQCKITLGKIPLTEKMTEIQSSLILFVSTQLISFRSVISDKYAILIPSDVAKKDFDEGIL
jgi:hypothetical protein